MIWEWRLIMSLLLKHGPSKILRHLVTRNTINLEKHSCKNIAWWPLPFSSSKKQMSHHVNIAMYSYILVYKPSTKHKLKKHSSSNNWLLYQAKACTTTWWFTTIIPHSHETIRHISFSSLETKLTLPSLYNIHVTINRPHKPTLMHVQMIDILKLTTCMLTKQPTNTIQSLMHVQAQWNY